MGKGDVFGELAALDGQLREATVVTTLASELLVLSRWAVRARAPPAQRRPRYARTTHAMQLVPTAPLLSFAYEHNMS